MFKSRGRKIFRDVWGRKGRTAMASVSIFIGVLGVVVLISIGDLVTSQLREDKKEQEYAMLQVSLALPGEPELDNAAYIETLKALPGIENVEGRVFGMLFWKRPGDAKFEDGWLFAGWEPFDETAIQPLRLVKGRFPEAGKNEIAIERRMAEAQGLEIGDSLLVGVLAGGAPQEETWTVVGTVFQPYGVGMMPGAEENSTFVTYADAQHIGGVGFEGLSSLHARYIDFGTAQQLADDFLAAIEQQTPYVPQYNYLVDPASEMEATQQTIGMLFILALMAMIVSGFLITNIINTIIVEQRQQIGVMKSLGATRLDNLLMYIGIALSYGVIGMVPGVLLGAVIGGVAAKALGTFFTAYIEGFNISVIAIVMGVVMGLLVPLLAALLPIFLGTRVTILQAMTDLGIAVDYGRGILARLIGVLPLPINVRQALSNVTRKKGRLVLTWLTLTLAIGVFMGVLGSFFALDTLVDGIFNTFGYQLQVRFNESQDLAQMQAFITDNVAGVKAVYPAVGGVSIQIEGYVNPDTGQSSPESLGFDTQSDSIRFNLDAGTAWRDDPDREGVVLSSNLAKQLGKGVGDRLVFSAGGQAFEREIIGVTSLALDFVFLDWRDIANIGEQVLGEPPPQALLIQLDNADASVAEVDEVIDQIKETLLVEGITAGFVNWKSFSDFIAQMMVAFSGVFIAAALVMAAVGAVGLLATLSMAVFERQKEIGVMRSIGASSATISGQFIVEGNLIGLLAWIVGLPLSFLVSAILGTMFPFEIEAGVPPFALLIGLVGMIVIATISSLWPSISAARKTVSQIIRYQ
jgi:putative ABC transport system permease protein